ncbi:MAG: hypothetical protein K1X78_03020 [Verrucomicrobiaceae bacterium]|nr:hypothetical protein [Verrucomicrobiaceae bacterium]
MSAIALPEFERDIHAALARVLSGESLILLDGGRSIAQITPAPRAPAKGGEPVSLAEFFLNSPLRDSGIQMERDRSPEREAPAF